MRFVRTALRDVVLVVPEPAADARGSFARVFCAEEFRRQGLVPDVAQCNLVGTTRRGTVRGLHLQRPPGEEAKLVRCLRGAVHDVVVDLRDGSPTHGRHVAVRLSTDDHRALYVPPGCAHGYQSLVDDSEVLYQVSHPYRPDLETGVRHDDPVLGIDWPLPVTRVSDKDRSWPPLAATPVDVP